MIVYDDGSVLVETTRDGRRVLDVPNYDVHYCGDTCACVDGVRYRRVIETERESDTYRAYQPKGDN